VKVTRLNLIIWLGLAAIVGILVAQLLWTRQAFSLEEKKFSQRVHIALLEVARKLYEGTNHDLPSQNPVEKMSGDYYVVNVANDFDPDVLEFYLKSEFKKRGIDIDFEYAMYNCSSDAMVYGNYVSMTDKSHRAPTLHFPKHKNLVYYFAIRFPGESSVLFSSLRFWLILSLALTVILVIYVYSIFTILQQKKYSELQRDFINNMTHEFKTPLSSILLAANYLKKQDVVAADGKLEKYTSIIVEQGNKLNDHIGKILNIAKADNAPLALEKQPIDPVQIVTDVAENLKLRHPKLRVSVESAEPFIIEADAFHFTNLVHNLIDNAVKYCEGDPAVSVSLKKENGKLKMSFADNGIGVENDKDLGLMFGRFHRIKSKKSNEVTGFGLGLYYVRKICLLHGWEVSPARNPQNGITITITIPLRQ